MKKYTVGYVIGSIATHSINRTYAQALIKLAPAHLSFEEIQIKDLPMYSYDMDHDFPNVAQEFKNHIKKVDAILFMTPEYNRSFPGVLKNALDFGSRPWGDNSWAAKPAAIMSVSVGHVGGALGHNHLKQILNYFDMPLMNQPEIYVPFNQDTIKNGEFVDEKSQKFALTWMESFHAFLEKQV